VNIPTEKTPAELSELYILHEKEEEQEQLNENLPKVLADIHNQEMINGDQHLLELVDHNYDCINKRR
jgi:hypothetical protein